MSSPASGEYIQELSTSSRKQTPLSGRRHSPGSRHGRRAPQGRQQWESFSDERAKKKKQPRRTVWSSTVDPRSLQPEDPSMLEAILREMEEALNERSSPSSPSTDRLTSGPGRPASAPGNRWFQASPLASPSPATTLQRPQSAPMAGSSPQLNRQRPVSSSRPKRLHLQRPQSAPRLLDGSGLLEKRPHNSPFLQKVEDSAVKETITKFKRDQQCEKADIARIDFMHDTSFFDLKVLHNAIARKKTEKMHRDSPPRNARGARDSKGRDARGAAAGVHRIGPRHPGWSELRAVDRVRNLCHVMDMDMRLHGPQSPGQVDTTELCMSRQISSEEEERKPRRKSLMMSGLSDGMNFGAVKMNRHRTSNFVANQSPEMVRITVNLLDFILEKCSNLSEFVRVLNLTRQDAQDIIARTQGDGFVVSSRREGQGKVTRREFETALMALGYVSDDPSRFFRALDNENAGELLCEEIIEALEAYGPNLIERRLGENTRTGSNRATINPNNAPRLSQPEAPNAKLDADFPGASASSSDSEASEND